MRYLRRFRNSELEIQKCKELRHIVSGSELIQKLLNQKPFVGFSLRIISKQFLQKSIQEPMSRRTAVIRSENYSKALGDTPFGAAS